ncbi:MAG: exodeoxyribonuclease VII large subunit [Clostridia bacterium]|nr:exodeoxyribonuclease VII large subunit [Clostridia bacterium]
MRYEVSGRGTEEQPIKILSVTELNRMISLFLSQPSLQSLRVRGQVSGFRPASSGHWYFDLKDENGTCIPCCIWSSTVRARGYQAPRNGAQITLRGKVSFYEAGGRVSFVADSMETSGLGLLWLEYEQLKRKLQSEGLFDQERKRPIPFYPRKIALVTSLSGEVVHDVCKIARERNPMIPICVVPIPVQGDAAVPQIVRGLQTAAHLPDVDLIITGRGGGSLEDLWCFNDERVARAIAASPVPVITAIGHQPDHTIADDVADMSASTPSNAAELAIQDRSLLLGKLHALQSEMYKTQQQLLTLKSLQLADIRQRLSDRAPSHVLELHLQQVQLLENKLHAVMARRFDTLQMELAERENHLEKLAREKVDSSAQSLKNVSSHLSKNAPDAKIAGMEKALIVYQNQMISKIDRIVQTCQVKLSGLTARIDAMNPGSVLRRGYAMVTDPEGHVLTSSTEARGLVTIHFADGQVDAQTLPVSGA